VQDLTRQLRRRDEHAAALEAEIRTVLADHPQQLVGRRTVTHIIGSQWVQTPRRPNKCA
jgi:hypothetical protein